MYNNFEALDSAEERALIEAAQSAEGQERVNAIERLWQQYAPTVRSAVRRFSAERTEREDMEQEAYAAFLEVLRDHDVEADGRLRTRLQRHLWMRLSEAASAASAAGWSIPRRQFTKFLQILKDADNDLAKAQALAPSPKYQMSEDTFAHIAALLRSTGSLSAGSDEEGERDAANSAAAVLMGAGSGYDAADAAHDRWLALQALQALEPETRVLVEMKYGFREVEYAGAVIEPPVSDGILAALLGLSRQKVQRTHQAALKTMRAALGVPEEIEEGK